MRIGLIKQWVQPGETKIFGDIKLKPMQNAIINCNKNFDVLVNLPTGFGKSILFQYPASHLQGKCIIVFVPLKALLWDCLKEAELHNLTAEECENKFAHKYFKNNYLPKMLFLTPERFFKNDTVSNLITSLYQEGKIDRIVIDEAHCISQWGSDFRPDYARLCQLRTLFPQVRLLGMSATIPPEARNDLVVKLKIQGSYYFQSSSNRTNLIYEIHSVQRKHISVAIMQYLSIKKLTKEYGIVYCQTIKHAEEVFKDITALGLDCCLFHSKMKQSQREDNFDRFMNNEVQCIIATICFGMGVNKKNIRYVINAGISLSAENYYQESGRAGRDGQISYCLLLTYKQDVNPLQYMICESTKVKKQANRRIYKLNQLKSYTKGKECRKRALFRLLGEDFAQSQCNKTCDYCENGQKEEQGYEQIDFTQYGTIIVEQLQNHSRQKVTRIQLAGLLKGKDCIKNAITKQKLNRLSGLMKSQIAERIESLIQELIDSRLLIAVPEKIKMGKFKKFVEYLKPCTKPELKKQNKITIRVMKKRKTEDLGKRKTELPQRYNKFEKYLKARKKTQETSFEEMVPLPLILSKKMPNFIEPNNNIFPFNQSNLKGKRPFQQSQDQLKEIKMVNIGNDYNGFFDDLFPDNTAEELMEINKEDFQAMEGHTNIDADNFQLDNSQEENTYLLKQKQNKQTEVKGQILTKKDMIDLLMDSDSSLDEQIQELMRKKKQKKEKEKQDKQKGNVILRQKINERKLQFI